MSDPGKAVFLSYASQDAEAAKRICDALRAAGIEVWFDQSELVGGDAWDAKIRGQISSCALFVPVISANTQARLEGYFRIEWKLAAQRTHAMADEKTFLLPVVIDDTRDAEAKVPAEFKAVQWTRLSAEGEAISAFGGRIAQLLGGGSVSPGTTGDDRASPKPATGAAGRRSRMAALAAAVAAIGVAGWLAVQSDPPPAAPSVAATSLAVDKSIAVLPFQNRSDQAADAYFTDGIHEDILTNLAAIRDIRVVSRTSVMEYRNTTKKSPEIGRELRVAYLLEGSVQRAGGKVRVTAQLIDARTDHHVWAKNYDKDMTDIFAVQSALSEAIAGALRAVLSPEEQRQVTRRPTSNGAAYDLYLQARGLAATLRSRALPEKQVELLNHAVVLDPNFAEAWADLAVAHARYIDRGFDTSPERHLKADQAIAQAIRLAPDAPEVIRAVADYAAAAYEDHARAREQYEKLSRLQPNDGLTHTALASTAIAQGRWSDALASARRATQLDPASRPSSVALLWCLTAGRRWPEAAAEAKRWLQLRPDDLEMGFRLGTIAFYATGDAGPGRAFFADLKPEVAATTDAMFLRKQWDFITGDLTHYLELDRKMPEHPDFAGARNPERYAHALVSAFAYLGLGDRAGALARLEGSLDEVRDMVRREPRNPQAWTTLSTLEALAGDAAQAVPAGRRTLELQPINLSWPLNFAITRAWVGDHDGAIADLARLFEAPANTYFVQGVLNVHQLRAGATMAPLKGIPRFEALLLDPKNNAPLF